MQSLCCPWACAWLHVVLTCGCGGVPLVWKPQKLWSLFLAPSASSPDSNTVTMVCLCLFPNPGMKIITFSTYEIIGSSNCHGQKCSVSLASKYLFN